VDNKDSI